MPLNQELIHLLVCPVCKGPLVLLPREDGLLCEACRKVYPVTDEIPVMLEEEAVPLDDWTGSRPE